MAKYDSRFSNFFLNLRLNRAEFGQMAAFTLEALRQSPEATTQAALITDLAAAHTAYATNHAGQLSGEGKASTVTVAQALADFKDYVKSVERKHVIPAYEENSADWLAVFPQGRGWLTSRPQASVLDAFDAFLTALDARVDAFPATIRQKGRTLHAALRGALQAADATTAATDTQRDDLHDGREATCQQLFRIYAALLLIHYQQPQRVAAFFDLSKAKHGGKQKKAQLPKV